MKGIFIPDITVEMFRNGCLEAIEALMAEGEVYDIEYDPKSAEPEVIRCKDCKHRYEDECPMHYEEWVSFEEDGYIDSDYVARDQTRDDGFCDRGEVEDE